MTKEEIYNQYAIEQGYFDWNDLMNEFVIRHMDNKNCEESFRWINNHQNAVTDLIQEELKKKICDTLTLVHDMPYIEIKETINETEIL